jgi:hypothetical protein
VERTLDTNVKAQKTPFIITGTDKELLTLKNIYNKIDNNEPAIYLDKSFDLKSIEVLNIKAPLATSELQDYKQTLMNEFLTKIGVNNANTDKKERLIMDEVNSNNEVITSYVDLMLTERLNGCKLINEMFGLNISVKLKNEQEEPEAEPDTQEEGDINE